MSAFNDRRSNQERRHGDRRWLGIFTHRESADLSGRKGADRRMRNDRREKNSIYCKIAF